MIKNMKKRFILIFVVLVVLEIALLSFLEDELPKVHRHVDVYSVTDTLTIEVLTYLPKYPFMEGYVNRWGEYNTTIACLLEENRAKLTIDLPKGHYKIYGITNNYWVFAVEGTNEQIAVNFDVPFWKEDTVVSQYEDLSEEEKASFIKATYKKSVNNEDFSVN